jgi:hypothetical protein
MFQKREEKNPSQQSLEPVFPRVAHQEQDDKNEGCYSDGHEFGERRKSRRRGEEEKRTND